MDPAAMLQCFTTMFLQQFMNLSNMLVAQFEERRRARNQRRRRLVMQMLQQRNLLMFQAFQESQRFRLQMNPPIFIRPRTRQIGAKPRSTHWWFAEVLQLWDDDRWIENFRMTKSTFLKLCQNLEEELRPSLLAFGRVLSVQQKVAIAVFKLASCAEYRAVGNLFGVRKSTVHCVLYEFCLAVNKIMLPLLIKFPNSLECKEIAHGFQQRCKMLNIIGAMDLYHVPVTAPFVGQTDYLNRKGWPSIILQAVVDDRGMFRYISCKHTGSCHDTEVFAESTIFQNEKKVISQETFDLDGVSTLFMILADSAYPLLPHWLVPHHNPANDDAKRNSFNVYHSSGRIVVEQAFGRLKGRWQCMLRQSDIDVEFMPQVVATCCVLYNFVESNNEKFLEVWTEQVEQAELIFEQPDVVCCQRHVDVNAGVVRDKLTDHLFANYPHHISALQYNIQRQ